MNIPKYLNEFEEELNLQGKSKVTVATYKSLLKSFLIRYKYKPEPDHINSSEIKGYLVAIRSRSTLIQTHSVLNIFYTNVIGQHTKIDKISRPKRKNKLPVVLNKKEALAIINQPSYIKHRAMLYLLYSSGIRISELLNLKVKDIDSDRMVIHIWDGKGGKDRITLLGRATLHILREYFKVCRPKLYLFEGADYSKYSSASVNKVIGRATRELSINKVVTAHTFRHSFATQLLENKVDLFKIQKLLGHSSIKTTQIYLQVSSEEIESIVSPLDFAIAG